LCCKDKTLAMGNPPSTEEQETDCCKSLSLECFPCILAIDDKQMGLKFLEIMLSFHSQALCCEQLSTGSCRACIIRFSLGQVLL